MSLSLTYYTKKLSTHYVIGVFYLLKHKMKFFPSNYVEKSQDNENLKQKLRHFHQRNNRKKRKKFFLHKNWDKNVINFNKKNLKPFAIKRKMGKSFCSYKNLSKKNFFLKIVKWISFSLKPFGEGELMDANVSPDCDWNWK